MNLDAFRNRDADFLIQKVSTRLRPVFTKNRYSDDEKRAIYRYLFSRRPKKLPPSLRAHIINLYDPLADRSGPFPDGLRWCLNVYVGCEHNCGYCYVNGYSQESVAHRPHAKDGFEKKLIEDLQTLRMLVLPPAPLHMSNSTDPLQENLEGQNHHTLFSLEKILAFRDRFTSVVMLTKNPGRLCTPPYLSILSQPEMRQLTVQVTCSYWDDSVRLFYEPHAPSVQSRLEAIRFLTERGVTVELRIDPLFPSSRIGDGIRLHKPLPNYSIPEAQPQDDIANLVRFARESRVAAIIAKPLKVPVSNRAHRCKVWFSDIYRDATREKTRIVRGGSWRLPEPYQRELVSTLSGLCDQEGIPFRHCMQDVLTRI